MALTGAYFFWIIAAVAFWMVYKKKEPLLAFRSIGIGATILAGISYISEARAGTGMFVFSASVGFLMFFGGMIGWGFYHRSKSR